MIWEEMKESLIFLDQRASHYREVLGKAGKALTKEGYAKDVYVDRLTEREENFPTGLDMGGIGIALPHTEARYVNKDGMALLTLKEPVLFYQMGADEKTVKVRLVFALTFKDTDRHLLRLSRILNIIRDREVLEELLSAKNAKEIIGTVRRKEEML